MNNSEKFINWLEGYLDACKNSLDINQVKLIRKKMKEVAPQIAVGLSYNPFTSAVTAPIVPLYDSLNAPQHEIDSEFLKEIEKNKNASTMEELKDDRLFEDSQQH